MAGQGLDSSAARARWGRKCVREEPVLIRLAIGWSALDGGSLVEEFTSC